MKKSIAAISMIILLAAMLCGCKRNTVTPTISPNVPVVSESPAIPSPDLSASPKPTATVQPSASLLPAETNIPAVSPTVSPTA